MASRRYETDEALRRLMMPAQLQANTDYEDGPYPGLDLRKYEVGRMLSFRQTDAEEKHCPASFRRNDRLRVLPANPGGMGIMVRRLSDGEEDMVWPTEVVLSRKGAPRAQR